MVLWSDLNALSKANLAAVQATTVGVNAQTKNAPVPPNTSPSPNVTKSSKTVRTKPTKKTQAIPPLGAPKPPKGTESVSESLEDEQ
jgi:hypothetical protein